MAAHCGGAFNPDDSHWGRCCFIGKRSYEQPCLVAARQASLCHVIFCGCIPRSAALAILKVRPVSDRFSMGLAAFLGSAFWLGLIAAGFWSGTSYGFLNDPVLGNVPEPELAGIVIYPNVVAAIITIAIAVVGYGLAGQAKAIEQSR